MYVCVCMCVCVCGLQAALVYDRVSWQAYFDRSKLNFPEVLADLSKITGRDGV